MARSVHADIRVEKKSYAKRMCNEVAYALLVHTMLLIFVTAPSLSFGDMSIVPYLMLIVMVALAMPYLRNLEKKWRSVTGSDISWRKAFMEDRIALWGFTIAMPLVYKAVAMLLASLLA